MEGRTIVRPGAGRRRRGARPRRRFNGGPDNCPARPRGGFPVVPRPCRFNGGPDNCPARRSTPMIVVPSLTCASMEGRTIVRPGASNRPRTGVPQDQLQWRAGQLSGQACAAGRPPSPRTYRFNGGPDNCPARPPCSSTTRWCCRSFNGGPDNCPARQGGPRLCGDRMNLLQWRAGQLSGQAEITQLRIHTLPMLQWRAGQLSGQAFSPTVS